MEADIARLKEKVSELDKRVEQNSGDIKSLEGKYYDISKDILIIKIDASYTRESVDKIQKTLEELSKNQLDDHYKKPLKRHEEGKDKIKWVVVGILTSGITLYVLSKIFPFINW